MDSLILIASSSDRVVLVEIWSSTRRQEKRKTYIAAAVPEFVVAAHRLNLRDGGDVSDELAEDVAHAR